MGLPETMQPPPALSCWISMMPVNSSSSLSEIDRAVPSFGGRMPDGKRRDRPPSEGSTDSLAGPYPIAAATPAREGCPPEAPGRKSFPSRT